MGQSTWSHSPPSGKAAESVFTDLMTCLPPAEGIQHTLPPFHTTRKSAPLSGGARCLLSRPLQSGVRLFRDPLPAAYSHASQRAYPSGGPSGQEDNGFTEFHGDVTVGWV